jgi:hypothetical protein
MSKNGMSGMVIHPILETGAIHIGYHPPVYGDKPSICPWIVMDQKPWNPQVIAGICGSSSQPEDERIYAAMC